MTKEALKLVLDALHKGKVACEWGQAHDHVQQIVQAMEAIKEALAQTEHEFVRGECVKCSASIERQKPVVWMYQDKSTHEVRFQKHMRDFVDHGATYETPLYTTQPQRTWVGLTDDEIVLIVAECAASHQHTDIHFARAIEAKLKERNT